MPKQLANRYALISITNIQEKPEAKILGPYHDDDPLEIHVAMRKQVPPAVKVKVLPPDNWINCTDKDLQYHRLAIAEVRVPVRDDHRYIDITFDEDTGEHVITIKTTRR